MPPNPTIVCKECGYVNESERVYCHGCGTKLDRALLIAQQETETMSAEKRHREVKKMMTPGGGFFERGGRMFIRSVAWAAAAALFIDMALPPVGAPPLPKKGEIPDYPQIDMNMERLVAAPTGQTMLFREAEVNAFLKAKGKFTKVPTWITGIIPLQRAFVNFEDGVGRLTIQGDIAGYPLYIGLSGRLAPKKDASGVVFTCVGGNIGRLQIPAQVAQYAGMAVPTLMGSFKHEQQLLGQLGEIEIAKGQATLRSRGAAPAVTPAAPSALNVKPAGR